MTFICQYYCFMHLPYDGSCYLIDHRQGQELALLPVLALTSCKSPKTRRKAPNPQLQIHTKQPFICVNEDNWFFTYASEKVIFQNLWPNGKKKKKKLNTSVLFLLLSVALTQRTVCSNNRRWKQTAFIIHHGQNLVSSLLSLQRTHQQRLWVLPGKLSSEGRDGPQLISLLFSQKHIFQSTNFTVSSNGRLGATPETHSTSTKSHGHFLKPSQRLRAGSRLGLTATCPAALSSPHLPHPFQMLLEEYVQFPHVKAASCPSSKPQPILQQTSSDNTCAGTRKQPWSR